MNEPAEVNSSVSSGQNRAASVDGLILLGVALTALAILSYEILLTRIFSVLFWYHFAFMAVSITMFGMTAGALFVYLNPKWFSDERIVPALSFYSICFAVTLVIATISFGLAPLLTSKLPLHQAFLISLSINFVLNAVPFFFGGVVIGIALTKFPSQISKIYAFDLVGAGFGCFFVIVTLSIVDAPSALFIVASVVGVAGLLFSVSAKHSSYRLASSLISILCISLAVANCLFTNDGKRFVSVYFVKGKRDEKLLYEKWNCFSRVDVVGDKENWSDPAGWALSRAMPLGLRVRQLWLHIDGCAGTAMTHYSGDESEVKHLNYDVVSVAHHFRKGAKVLVIGVGGGRDVLTAVVFKQPSITGVEVNGAVLNTVEKVFGNFTGHLETLPGVKLINADARSYIAGTNEKFDIIQASLIDTWAATQSGALALTENSIYTKEAWIQFRDHLTDKGVVTFSRWYQRWYPAELYRLVALVASVLKDSGVSDPRQHLFVVYGPISKTTGVATVIMTRSPITQADGELMREICTKLQFPIMLSPDQCLDQSLGSIASGDPSFIRKCKHNLAPPTDDRPYFFQMTKLDWALTHFFKKLVTGWDWGGWQLDIQALLLVTLVSVTLSTLCIVFPLWLKNRSLQLLRGNPLVFYFVSIGFGFMMIEMSQMQRLSQFLGSPTLSLAVILFSLLASGGIGSFATGKKTKLTNSKLVFVFLILTMVLTGLLTSPVVTHFESRSLTERAIISVLLICPVGFFMGMVYPLGLKLASRSGHDETLSWYWALNGAASVVASILAIMTSLFAGISATYWLGCTLYIAATVIYIQMRSVLALKANES